MNKKYTAAISIFYLFLFLMSPREAFSEDRTYLMPIETMITLAEM